MDHYEKREEEVVDVVEANNERQRTFHGEVIVVDDV